MDKIYGYCRCSTNERKQDISRQKRDLKQMGVTLDENIYFEYESGTKIDRVELNKLLDKVEEGDSICVTEVSRLSRSTKHLCEILQLVQEKHIRLIIGTSFTVDCRNDDIDPMTKGMIMMWAVFSELERDMISDRIKSGMRNARAKGKLVGRPKTTINDLPSEFIRYYDKYKENSITIMEFSKLSGLSRPTIYKYIKLVEG